MSEPLLVALERAGVVEARHEVHAVVLRDGAPVAAWGDPDLVAHLRSSAKPLQAIPLVSARPDLPADEVAIACASHEGTPDHVAVAARLLARSGAAEDDLVCGCQDGRAPRRLAHNCSGNHAALLAAAASRGWPLAGYERRDHPVNVEVFERLLALTGLAEPDVAVGVDGCGIPSYGIPLHAAARLYGSLPAPIVAAMAAHPWLVGGDSADDTALMRLAPGWIAKRGAEGLVCAAGPGGLAVAAKCRDGSMRPFRPALAEVLRTVGVELPGWDEVAVRSSTAEQTATLRLVR